MKRPSNSNGFAVLEACLVLVAVVGLGIIGYTVYKDNQSSLESSAGTYSAVSSGNSASNAASPANTSTPSVPTIKNEASLNQVEAALDSVNPSTSNASDSNSLNSQTNF